MGMVTLASTPRPLPPGAGYLAGVLAGFTSFVAHAGGPAALMYLLSQGLTKTAFQATTVIVFAILNVTKAAIYAQLGFFSPDALRLVALLAPAALVGAILGVRANRVIPEKAFFGLTYVLLLGAGAKLIWGAVV